MQAKEQPEFVPCIPGAFPGGLSRTRFFDGMFLTQRDLEREQKYWTMKRRLTNRALGQGIVWGLRLEWDSLRRRFRIGPGYGLDCCGNDLIVECPQEIAERTLVDKSDPSVRELLAGKLAPVGHCAEPAAAEGPIKACIALQYVECPEEPRPVHQDACATNITRCEFSAMRETARVLLVPPPAPRPPGPVDEFCFGIEELKRECEELDEKCKLFFPEAAAAETELKAAVRLAVAGRVTVLRPSATPGSQSTEVTIGIRGPDDLYFYLEPDPGYVFLSGAVTDAAGNSVRVQPFGVELGKRAMGGGNGPETLTIQNLVLAPLFQTGPHSKMELELTIEEPETTQILARVSTAKAEETRESEGCARRFVLGGVFAGDPECTVKTLVLSTLCGWFAGMLGAGQDEAFPGRGVAAWWICALAWRLIFNANLADPERAKLSKLLQRLFERLCAGLVYPGPRCTEDHAGVYLGCIELSRQGRILSFDPWECRRHVITGPLLSHWGMRLGLAPMDVVVSRFARWLCCVATREGLGLLSAQQPDAEGVYIPAHEDGAGLYYGGALDGFLQERGLVAAGERREVDMTEMARLLLGALMRPATEASRLLGAGRRVYSVPGRDLYFLEPGPSRRIFDVGTGEYLRGAIENASAGLKPMARATAGALAGELANSVKLADLKVAAAYEPFVEALAAAEVSSVADYLSLGPEAGAELALAHPLAGGGTEATYAAAEAVFEAAESLVVAMVEPVKAAAAGTDGPFVRTKLKDESLNTALRKATAPVLKRNKLTKAGVSEIVERVVAGMP